MLKRGIRRWDLVFLIINSVIGAGIFALPAKVFALSGVYSLLAFLVCSVVMLIYILVFSEVSSRFDQTGGPYIYVLSAFGSLPAFVIGWLLMLTRLFSYATLINLLVIYLSYFSDVFTVSIVRIVFIWVLTFVIVYFNWIGVKNTARVSNFLTVGKLIPLALFIIVGLFYINSSSYSFGKFPPIQGFSQSALLLIFAFGGFEAGLVNSGEIDNPKKNLPFALMVAAGVIAVFYFLIQLVCIGTLPDLAESDRPLADAAAMFSGYWGGVFISLGAIISIMGTLNVQILSGSRIPFALSMEDQLPLVFSKVHPRFATPWFSILFFSLLVALVATVWTFMSSLAVSVIARLIMYALVCASLIRLRKSVKLSAPFKIPFGNGLAVAGIVATLWLLSSSHWQEIKDTLMWVGFGLLIYILHVFHKKMSRKN